jgi:dienelactone hydrolase
LFLVAYPLFAAGVAVRFNPTLPEIGPFPSDYLTVADPAQKTGKRVNLPLPDCAAFPTTCQETALLNQLDGFSLLARARVRFSGPVNTATLRDGLFYLALDNLLPADAGVHRFGDVIRVNQVVYDPAANTVYAKPDVPLDQHRRYAVVVTDAVRDTEGGPVGSDAVYDACVGARVNDYCAVLAQLAGYAAAVASPRQVVAVSLFTTLSATSWLERARAALAGVAPAPAMLQPRSVFRVADMVSLTLSGQTGTRPVSFTDLSLPLDPTLLAGLGRLAVGSFRSPGFLDAGRTLAAAPTAGEAPRPVATEEVFFNVLLPDAPAPSTGYPVVIYGHGLGDSRFGGPTAVASTLARSGYAVIAITAVGHGFGPLSTFTIVERNGTRTTLLSGGRGLDLNGDGVIESDEGCTITAPVALGLRDCLRQTTVDLMQLVRAIRAGIDVDGDGKADLDGARIYYAGQSLGGIYGTVFTAMEPAVRAAVLNVGGATVADIARWSPAYRGEALAAIGGRTPSLLNKGATYDENYVLRDQPVKINDVPGAIDIQNVFESLEWAGMAGDPVAFAPHLRASPLAGNPPRPVLFQVARGDQTVPNPTSAALVRAAGAQASTSLYRHDLARAAVRDLPANPHSYLTFFLGTSPGGLTLPGPVGLSISLLAQQQLAGFLDSGGATIPDPGALLRALLGVNLFEIGTPLPEDLGF